MGVAAVASDRAALGAVAAAGGKRTGDDAASAAAASAARPSGAAACPTVAPRLPHGAQSLEHHIGPHCLEPLAHREAVLSAGV